MLSDWCKGIGYNPAHKEFGLLVKGRKGLAPYSLGFKGDMMWSLVKTCQPSIVFDCPPYTPTILPINLCKWETEE